jgi:hypothetical protein
MDKPRYLAAADSLCNASFSFVTIIVLFIFNPVTKAQYFIADAILRNIISHSQYLVYGFEFSILPFDHVVIA